MIASMTGFGRGEAGFEGGTFTVEIRSVNHRYADFAIRLPRTLSNFESRIKELIKNRLTRGYINYQLTWDREEKQPSELTLNEEVIQRYLELFRGMQEEFGIEGKPTVETFSRLPDVFRQESQEWDEELLWAQVEKATAQALEKLVEMRLREGEALAADLLHRLDLMEKHMDSAKLKSPERLAKLVESLREKLRAVVGNDLDENRLLTEITYYADKWDFSEEDVRFRSHLEAMRRTIEKGGVVGRRLNFLVQELNREVNTVASKANDAEITQLMVSVKEEIEKVREQVENLE
jgi:uncharacterized protein (TIGR00255 family)